MEVEPFSGEELHLHVCGSIAASLVPWWIHVFRTVDPHTRINASVTTSATRFVTKEAIEILVDGDVWIDRWSADGVPSSVTEGVSNGSQAIVVFPASLDTLMRLSQGRADTPAMMLLQTATMPIVIADSLPTTNPIIDAAVNLIHSRPNVAFAPRVQALRAADRTVRTTGFNWPGAIQVANELLAAKGTAPK